MVEKGRGCFVYPQINDSDSEIGAEKFNGSQLLRYQEDND